MHCRGILCVLFPHKGVRASGRSLGHAAFDLLSELEVGRCWEVLAMYVFGETKQLSGLH